jgi:hypothetical protein
MAMAWYLMSYSMSAAVFNNSSHLIDYVKWSLRILGKRKTFKMLPPKVLKHNCFIALINAFAQKLQFGYSFYSE